MDDNKYSGCNIVESVVTRVERKKTEKPGKSRGTFFARLTVAAAIVGAILALHFLPIPGLSSVKSTLRDVFCYDFFGRTEFGTSVLFG
ncbi:MAG: hypothetical protein J1G01_05375 [Clostridiales bacterium]|nr:hypothetical protein [Clostridiales bacterium]